MATVEEELAPETEETTETALPERWSGVLVVEGIRTDDDREFSEGALSWRELPIPFMWQKEDSHGGIPTTLSVQVGMIDEIEKVDGEVYGSGSFDLGSEDGREAARRVTEGLLRHVSVDVAATEWEVYEEGDCTDSGGFLFFAEGQEDAPAEPDEDDVLMDSSCHIIDRVTEGLILAATLVPMPAFPQAEIAPLVAGGEARLRAHPVPQDTTERAEFIAAGKCEPCFSPLSLIASGIPTAPPREWFEDPGLQGPTPLTVTADGRVFGHIAQWGVCHRGLLDRCVMAPRNSTGYQAFHSGGHVICADGSEVRVGHFTIGGDHPGMHLSATDALSQYADASSVWADVRLGEDNHGIWASGCVLPDVDEFTLRRARSLAMSGDWRQLIPGAPLELIAALSVPVPGFPISDALVAAGVEIVRGPRVKLDEAGQVVALVAAGLVRPHLEAHDEIADLSARLAVVERVSRALTASAAQSLYERIQEGAG